MSGSIPNGGSISLAEVWTPLQWAQAWQSKQDVLSGNPLPSLEISGQLTAGSASVSGALNVGGALSGNVFTSGIPDALTLSQMLTAFGGVPDSVFGCVGNGATDDAPAIQAAVNWLTANGGGILFMRGLTYLVNYASSGVGVQINGLVTIVGVGWNETNTAGTRFYTTQSTVSPFNFGFGASGSAGFKNCLFYQNQPAPTAGWTPTLYPPVIAGLNVIAELQFDNLMFYGVNKGMSFIQCARHRQTRIHGQAFTYMLYADQEADDSFYDEWKCWPYWSENVNVYSYTQAYGDCIYLQRNDGPQMGKISILGYRSGLRIGQSTSGSTPGTVNHLFADHFYADACKYPVWVDSTVTSDAILVFNNLYTGGQVGQGGSTIAGSTGIQIDGQCEITVGGDCYLLYCNGSAITLSNNTLPSLVKIGNLTANMWDQAGSSAPAIFAANLSSAPTVCHQIYMSNAPKLRAPGTSNNYQIINGTTNARLWCPGTDALEVSANFTGATVAFGARPFALLADTSSNSTITSLTIELPSNPVDGMEIALVATKPIGSVTFLPASPSTSIILGAPSQIGAFAPVRFKYFGLSTSAAAPNDFWVLSSGFNAGGYTGNFTLDGTLNLASLATADPGLAGIVWKSNGELLVSNGTGNPAPNGKYSAVSAAGTTQTTATPIITQFFNISAGTSGEGVILTAPPLGSPMVFYGANTQSVAINVYPPVGAVFVGSSANAPYSLAANTSAAFSFYAGILWSAK